MGSVGSTLDVFWVDFAKSQTPFCKGILDLQTGSVRGSISPALLSLDDPESESCTIFGKVRVAHNTLANLGNPPCPPPLLPSDLNIGGGICFCFGDR